jgi:hypothetical protein
MHSFCSGLNLGATLKICAGPRPAPDRGGRLPRRLRLAIYPIQPGGVAARLFVSKVGEDFAVVQRPSFNSRMNHTWPVFISDRI